MRKLKFGKEARNILLQGCEIMYHAVGTTYSPKGRNVAMARPWGFPLVHHDGVGVAREVSDVDPFIRVGIDIIREAAEKQVRDCGDGTTVVTILTYHLVSKGMELLDKGTNAMALRTQMEGSVPRLIKTLESITVPISTEEGLAKVTSVSAGSEELGALVAQAMTKVGKDGKVVAEESDNPNTYVEHTEGMTFNKGFISMYFITNPSRAEAVVYDAAIIISAKRISLAKEIAPIINALVQKGVKDMVFFGDIQGDALRILEENKMLGRINCMAIDPPGVGDNRKALLDDIAVVTGAKVLRSEIGVGMSFDYKWVGNAETVKSDPGTTTIIGGKGAPEAIEKRINDLRSRKEMSTGFEFELIEERLARLTTGVAVIKVGARTLIAQREKIERVKDAIGAAEAALNNGVVPGGATAFVRMAEAFIPSNEGEKLVFDTLFEPFKKLLFNAGKNEKEIDALAAEMSSDKNVNLGYNANTDKIEDLVEVGVIDPSKVIRSALENSINVAGSILSSDCVIVIAEDMKGVPADEL